jgi:hypothetical protein
MGWGHIIAAWLIGSTGKRSPKYSAVRRPNVVDFGLVIGGLVSLAIIVMGIWPR